jgi:hypothetical protein
VQSAFAPFAISFFATAMRSFRIKHLTGALNAWHVPCTSTSANPFPQKKETYPSDKPDWLAAATASFVVTTL